MEIWKDIKGYENRYKASNLGRIKSLDYNCLTKRGTTQFYKGRIMGAEISNSGYKRVCLSYKSKQKKFSVHRLVAKTFISNPLNKKQVNHIDGDKLNNNVLNLEWVTPSENIKKAYKNKQILPLRGQSANGVILNESQVARIRSLLNSKKLTQNEIAKMFNVSRSCINNINNGYTWRHLK